jgi:two-component system, LytTR family, response regulator
MDCILPNLLADLFEYKTMKCIIVEDEFIIRSMLVSQLAKYFPDIEVVAELDSLTALESWMHTGSADLLFLDIHFPDGNSIDFVHKYRKELPYIIFVTAYPQFALDAIRLDGIDYILKPVDDEILKSAVQKYIRYSKLIEHDDSHLVHIPNGVKSKRIMIPSQSGYHIFYLDQIIRLSAEVNYTRIILKDKHPLLVAITLKNFEVALQTCGFLRVHKSHIVNTIHIDRYQKNAEGGILSMSDGTQVPLAKSMRNEFHDFLRRDVISLGF